MVFIKTKWWGFSSLIFISKISSSSLLGKPEDTQMPQKTQEKQEHLLFSCCQATLKGYLLKASSNKSTLWSLCIALIRLLNSTDFQDLYHTLKHKLKLSVAGPTNYTELKCGWQATDSIVSCKQRHIALCYNEFVWPTHWLKIITGNKSNLFCQVEMGLNEFTKNVDSWKQCFACNKTKK